MPETPSAPGPTPPNQSQSGLEALSRPGAVYFSDQPGQQLAAEPPREAAKPPFAESHEGPAATGGTYQAATSTRATHTPFGRARPSEARAEDRISFDPITGQPLQCVWICKYERLGQLCRSSPCHPGTPVCRAHFKHYDRQGRPSATELLATANALRQAVAFRCDRRSGNFADCTKLSLTYNRAHQLPVRGTYVYCGRHTIPVSAAEAAATGDAGASDAPTPTAPPSLPAALDSAVAVSRATLTAPREESMLQASRASTSRVPRPAPEAVPAPSASASASVVLGTGKDASAFAGMEAGADYGLNGADAHLTTVDSASGAAAVKSAGIGAPGRDIAEEADSDENVDGDGSSASTGVFELARVRPESARQRKRAAASGWAQSLGAPGSDASGSRSDSESRERRGSKRGRVAARSGGGSRWRGHVAQRAVPAPTVVSVNGWRSWPTTNPAAVSSPGVVSADAAAAQPAHLPGAALLLAGQQQLAQLQTQALTQASSRQLQQLMAVYSAHQQLALVQQQPPPPQPPQPPQQQTGVSVSVGASNLDTQRTQTRMLGFTHIVRALLGGDTATATAIANSGRVLGLWTGEGCAPEAVPSSPPLSVPSPGPTSGVPTGALSVLQHLANQAQAQQSRPYQADVLAAALAHVQAQVLVATPGQGGGATLGLIHQLQQLRQPSQAAQMPPLSRPKADTLGLGAAPPSAAQALASTKTQSLTQLLSHVHTGGVLPLDAGPQQLSQQVQMQQVHQQQQLQLQQLMTRLASSCPPSVPSAGTTPAGTAWAAHTASELTPSVSVSASAPLVSSALSSASAPSMTRPLTFLPHQPQNQ